MLRDNTRIRGQDKTPRMDLVQTFPNVQRSFVLRQFLNQIFINLAIFLKPYTFLLKIAMAIEC